MITSRLHRAKIELQSHQQWLSTFVAKHSSIPSRPFAPPARAQYHSVRKVVHPRTPSSEVRTSQRASKLNTKRLKSKKERGQYRIPSALPELREAVHDVQIGRIQTLYRSLDDKSALTPRDCRLIAQCLHYSLRDTKRSKDVKNQQRREDIEGLVAFAEELVKDITKGYLTPQCQAHVHLIGFFKESGIRGAGLQFWKWLETQDERYVDEDVYGAAIELLAVNGAPLSRLENLYKDALSRFPGSFSAYHLSPEAIVPFRERQTTLKGVPMALLQGILTARLLRGDSRNAYLALDTALRLYPDQVPPRYFQLFLEERPVLEAYTVFAIACRGGSLVPANQFRQLVTALRSSSNLDLVVTHGLAVRSMLSILYMYIGAGGRITPNVVNELVIGMTQFLRLKGIAGLEAEQKQKIVDSVMDLIRKSFTIFSRYGGIPGLPAFNSIITNLGGFGHSKQIIGVALADAQALGLQPNEITRRSVLTAAGTLRDADFVQKSWDELVKDRAASDQYPSTTDFYVLIKNAAATRQVEYATQEFQRFKKSLPESDHNGIALNLEDFGNQPPPNDDSESIDLSALTSELRRIDADLVFIDEKTQDSPQLQDFREQALPLTLLHLPSTTALPDAKTRMLYDQLTSEQRPQVSNEVEDSSSEQALVWEQSNPSSNDPMVAVSRTNMPFDVLRYENWKAINYLLERAEASDDSYLKSVDAAIAAGEIPPKRSLGLSLHQIGEIQSCGLSDVAEIESFTTRERNTVISQEIQNGHEQILRLRGRLGHDPAA